MKNLGWNLAFLLNFNLICACGEMADTLSSGGSERKLVRVQISPSAPKNVSIAKFANFLKFFSFLRINIEKIFYNTLFNSFLRRVDEPK